MIDAERMLGSLVRNALTGDRGRGRKRSRKRARGSSSTFGIPKSALVMGALGTAIAAFEHFSGKDTDSIGRGSRSPAPPSTGAPASLPPLPSAGGVAGSATDLPPIPTSTTAPDAEPSDALLLIQAMIAAAHADHELDTVERARILDAIGESGASEEDRAFIVRELDHPKSRADLAARATTPDLARQLYLASRMAIEVDTEAETTYLARLADQLGLSPGQVTELDAMLGSAGE